MFEDAGASVEMSEEAGCVMQVRVKLKPSEVDKCHKQAIKSVNKQISIPGFRKGKAPNHTVLERYPANIEQDFKENIIQESFQKALSLSKIYPVQKESITPPKIVSSSKEEGVEVTFSYEIYPEVAPIDFTKIKIGEVKKKPIEEKQVDEIINQVRKSNATYEKITDRAAKLGDFVVLSIDAFFEDGQKHPVVTKRRFEIGDQMQSWLRELVVGMRLSEMKAGMTAPSREASEKEKEEYKSMQVEVTLDEISEIVLPEFNDELAKRVGATTTAEILEKIHQNLEQQAIDEQKEEQIKLVKEKLLELYPIDLPQSLITLEKKERLKNKLATLKGMNISDEELKNSRQEIEREIDEKVVRDLRLYFLFRQITEQGNISVSTAELNALLARESHLQALHGKDNDTLRKNIERIRDNRQQQKTEEYVLSEVLKS